LHNRLCTYFLNTDIIAKHSVPESVGRKLNQSSAFITV